MSQDTIKKKSLAPEQRALEDKRNMIYGLKKKGPQLSSWVPATQFYSGHSMPDLETDSEKEILP